MRHAVRGWGEDCCFRIVDADPPPTKWAREEAKAQALRHVEIGAATATGGDNGGAAAVAVCELTTRFQVKAGTVAVVNCCNVVCVLGLTPGRHLHRVPFFWAAKTAPGSRAVDPTDPACRERNNLEQSQEDGRKEGRSDGVQ